VSRGFAAGVFALIDNKTRAGFYTVAANDIALLMERTVHGARVMQRGGAVLQQAGDGEQWTRESKQAA